MDRDMLVVDAIRNAIEESGDTPEELAHMNVLVEQLHDLESGDEPEDFAPYTDADGNAY